MGRRQYLQCDVTNCKESLDGNELPSPYGAPPPLLSGWIGIYVELTGGARTLYMCPKCYKKVFEDGKEEEVKET